MTESEFGKGFIYNLILFSKHWWKKMNDMETYKKMREKYPDGFSEEDCLSLWFNGASDHFYELEIPEKYKDTKIGNLSKELRDTSLHWGHGFQEKPTDKDFKDTFDKLEKLAMLIDKEVFGIKDIEATWS